jgi:hypothetical protein
MVAALIQVLLHMLHPDWKARGTLAANGSEPSILSSAISADPPGTKNIALPLLHHFSILSDILPLHHTLVFP